MIERHSPLSIWTYYDLLDSMEDEVEDEKDENPVQDEVPVTLAELICPKG